MTAKKNPYELMHVHTEKPMHPCTHTHKHTISSRAGIGPGPCYLQPGFVLNQPQLWVQAGHKIIRAEVVSNRPQLPLCFAQGAQSPKQIQFISSIKLSNPFKINGRDQLHYKPNPNYLPIFNCLLAAT